MTSLRGDSSSREPLLWVQLLGLAAWPLEALGLLLLLAGGDPGPFPLVERLFCWGLGALLPAVLFWRLPPDPWSLLLLQVPLRGRRERQRRLSGLPFSLGLRLVAAAGSLPLLALVWWADRQGGIAWSLSPLATTPRLLVLLICSPLLALMLWQWHQLVQAIWLLTRPPSLVEASVPLGLEQAQGRRLNLGLPLLLLPPLASPAARAKQPAGRTEPPQSIRDQTPIPVEVQAKAKVQAQAQEPDHADPQAPSAVPEPPTPSSASTPAAGPSQGGADRESSPSAGAPTAAEPAPGAITAAPSTPIETTTTGDGAIAIALAIDEQQPPEDGQGNDLNQQI